MEAAGRDLGPTPSRPALGALLVLGAASLWGSLGIFGRLAFEHGVPPLDVASTRAFLAFLGILPVALLRRNALRRLRPEARHLTLLVGYGAVGIGVFYVVYLSAIDRLPVAVAAALLYTAPAWVVAIAWVMGWEPVRPRRLLPLALVLLGAFLVTGAFRALAAVDLLGIGAGLASGASYAVFTALGKRIRERYDVVTTFVFAYGVGTLVLALFAPPWRALVQYPDALVVLLLMAAGPTLLAVLLFYFGIRFLDASTASMLATIEPVVAALLALAWLGERLDASIIAGTGLIIGAALLLRPGRTAVVPRSGRSHRGTE
jgi:drug/metabolite transporter, DME family